MLTFDDISKFIIEDNPSIKLVFTKEVIEMDWNSFSNYAILVKEYNTVSPNIFVMNENYIGKITYIKKYTDSTLNYIRRKKLINHIFND